MTTRTGVSEEKKDAGRSGKKYDRRGLGLVKL